MCSLHNSSMRPDSWSISDENLAKGQINSKKEKFNNKERKNKREIILMSGCSLISFFWQKKKLFLFHLVKRKKLLVFTGGWASVFPKHVFSFLFQSSFSKVWNMHHGLSSTSQVKATDMELTGNRMQSGRKILTQVTLLAFKSDGNCSLMQNTHGKRPTPTQRNTQT